jgi:hypothetical protein
VIDIAAIAAIARKVNALTIVDNTFATTALQRPLEHGADLVVHSATKYLGGHGELIAGIVTGRAALVSQIRLHGLRYLTGATLSPWSAFLILRGLKPLALRMAQHSRSALAVAELLSTHRAVAAVHYPGLPDFPQAAAVKRQMSSGGGLVSFELEGGIAQGRALVNALKLAHRAVSLGDAETLVQHPASMTHATYSAAERAEHGISDGLIRMSVGLEDTTIFSMIWSPRWRSRCEGRPCCGGRSAVVVGRWLDDLEAAERPSRGGTEQPKCNRRPEQQHRDHQEIAQSHRAFKRIHDQVDRPAHDPCGGCKQPDPEHAAAPVDGCGGLAHLRPERTTWNAVERHAGIPDR